MAIRRVCLWAVVFICAAGEFSAARATLIMEFDYSHDSTNFFAPGSDARATLNAAGDFFEANILDCLDSITPSGSDTWTASYTEPDTGNSGSKKDLIINEGEYKIFVGARDLGKVGSSNILGLAGPGGFSASGSTTFVNNVVTRGEGSPDDVRNPSASEKTAFEFARWGGSMAIDSDTNWELNHNNTVDTGELDLFSVILHEIGHVLGFGIADSWDNLINVSNQFTGAASVAAHGSNVPLQSGGGHWANGTTSTTFIGGTSQEAAMDPSIGSATRKVFTTLDMAGLSDMGWSITPEPGSLVLFAVALGGGLAVRRRRRGKGQVTGVS